jgi:hypothetical protein
VGAGRAQRRESTFARLELGAPLGPSKSHLITLCCRQNYAPLIAAGFLALRLQMLAARFAGVASFPRYPQEGIHPCLGFNLRCCAQDVSLALKRIALARVAVSGNDAMTNRLVQQHAFGPEAVSEMTEAYKKALRTLQFTQRYDGGTAVIARKIIEAARQGITGADALCERTLKGLVKEFEPVAAKVGAAYVHSSSSKASASFKSSVSKPSVNQP